MGINLNNSKGGMSTATNLAEINVTPLVDVMLVLLIVFMISAPLMQQGVNVELPRTDSSTLDDSSEPIILVVTRDKKVLLGEKVIPRGALIERLKALTVTKNGGEVFIRADEGVPYGLVAQVLATVKRVGIKRVGLVTQPGTAKYKL